MNRKRIINHYHEPLLRINQTTLWAIVVNHGPTINNYPLVWPQSWTMVAPLRSANPGVKSTGERHQRWQQDQQHAKHLQSGLEASLSKYDCTVESSLYDSMT